MARRRKYSDNQNIKLDQLTQDMAAGSIVTQAHARYLKQILEFMHEEYIAPLRAENAQLRARLGLEPRT